MLNITCMQSGCGKEFEEDEVNQCVSQELFEKYRRFLTNAMVDLDPNLRWCPNPTCDGYVKKNTGKKGSSDVVCDACKTAMCFACG